MRQETGDPEPICSVITHLRDIKEEKIPVVCGEKTSWYCDECGQGCCHDHFVTMGGGRRIICKECLPNLIKKSQERLESI